MAHTVDSLQAWIVSHQKECEESAFEEWKVKPRHHIFCNKDSRIPVEQCNQRQGLFKDYPQEGKSPDELVAEHFPNVTIRR